MGTANTIITFHQESASALEQAAARVLELDRKLSVFRPDSEIARLNAAAGKSAVPVSRDTLWLLSEAKRFSRQTGGAFSITTRPLSVLWKAAIQNGLLPDAAQIANARMLVNDSDLLLDEAASTASLRHVGQAVDLGGIAKGYAADETRRILEAGGVREAVLNFGGTVVVMGRASTVGIQHPREKTGVPMGRLTLRERAAVTSGDYEQYRMADGVRYHHLLDPKTGEPARGGLCSVTLLGKSAMELDALSTAVFVLGMARGRALAEQAGLAYLLVTDQLDVFCSNELRDSFSFTSSN